MSRLVIVRGLPGAGKSTVARMLANEFGLVHIEADQFFEQGGAYRFDPDQLPEAHAWCLRRATEILNSGGSVVVANTFVRVWEFVPYLSEAAQRGIPFEVIEVQGAFQNVHGVLRETVERMRTEWEDFPATVLPL